MKPQVFYYENELTDDFGECVKKIVPLPEKYVYASKNPFFRFFSFFIYRVVARPLVWIYTKIRFLHRFRGKEKIQKHKGGYFLYGNHTAFAADAFIPNILTVRRRNYILTGEAASSLTAILPLMKALGNIPLPSDPAHKVSMLRCVRQRIAEGDSVTVYPEGHIWPLYTGIRPYPADSFLFAASSEAPVFALTNCYKKKRFGKTPRIVSFIDGPFFPDPALSRAENAKALRDAVYEAMCRRASEESTYSYNEYVKKEKEP